MDAELVDDARLDGVLAAPEAETVPGDLRRTPDEEVEAPDVRVVGRRASTGGGRRAAAEARLRSQRTSARAPASEAAGYLDDDGPRLKTDLSGGSCAARRTPPAVDSESLRRDRSMMTPRSTHDALEHVVTRVEREARRPYLPGASA